MNLHGDKFTSRVEKLKKRMGCGDFANRDYRLLNVHLSIKEHMYAYRERPLWEDIHKLADMILHEELSDSHPDKVSREEYPIFSDAQLARRQEGKHVKNSDNTRIEVPIEVASEFGTDYRNYKYPKRRKRSDRENANVDKKTASVNDIRKAKHKAFVNGEDYIVVKGQNGEDVRQEIQFIRKNVKI
jgi:hypothetical protein